MTANSHYQLSPGLKVIRVRSDRFSGKRWMPQLALSQIFTQKTGHKTVSFV
jgi:hypothetical protein